VWCVCIVWECVCVRVWSVYEYVCVCVCVRVVYIVHVCGGVECVQSGQNVKFTRMTHHGVNQVHIYTHTHRHTNTHTHRHTHTHSHLPSALASVGVSSADASVADWMALFWRALDLPPNNPATGMCAYVRVINKYTHTHERTDALAHTHSHKRTHALTQTHTHIHSHTYPSIPPACVATARWSLLPHTGSHPPDCRL
jgi:hypothetical protein